MLSSDLGRYALLVSLVATVGCSSDAEEARRQRSAAELAERREKMADLVSGRLQGLASAAGFSAQQRRKASRIFDSLSSSAQMSVRAGGQAPDATHAAHLHALSERALKAVATPVQSEHIHAYLEAHQLTVADR